MPAIGPITVHANVIRHRDQLYLIPRSKPEHLNRDHSLIRLLEPAASSRCETLRSMLDEGSPLWGRFMLEPGAFADDGVLLALLVEIIDCGAVAPSDSDDALAEYDDPAGGLITLCRQLWARWSP